MLLLSYILFICLLTIGSSVDGQSKSSLYTANNVGEIDTSNIAQRLCFPIGRCTVVKYINTLKKIISDNSNLVLSLDNLYTTAYHNASIIDHFQNVKYDIQDRSVESWTERYQVSTRKLESLNDNVPNRLNFSVFDVSKLSESNIYTFSEISDMYLFFENVKAVSELDYKLRKITLELCRIRRHLTQQTHYESWSDIYCPR